ncbi:MAG: sigma-54-dependent transcriptional regulator [Desulfonatronovibrionaceae bacterium]
MDKGSDSFGEVVLVVEDDSGLSQLLQDELIDAGYTATGVNSAEQARKWLNSNTPDLILCDLKLPGDDGMQLLRDTRRHSPRPGFVMITAFGSVPQAVEALKTGADDFLTKPLDLDQLVLCVQRTLENRRLREEVKSYRELLSEGHFHGILGQSRAMQTLVQQIRQMAYARGPVLIVGESGTGKELAARAVHEEGASGKAPLVVLNCAGIPPELLESELFGHVAGAFTGASRQRKGLFSEAHGGSIFLDEISEMPLSMQAKLLRVLQDGRIRPVGSDKEVDTDVRIIAATNRDLEEEIAAGNFREDLFYRLETFTLRVPPLREREDDAEFLAAVFLHRCNARLNRGIRGFSDAALDVLRGYSYPGNVRELQNAVERAATFCRGSWITPQDLPERMHKDEISIPDAKVREPQAGGEAVLLQGSTLPSLEELKGRYIHYVLKQCGGNKRRAAALLGIGRRTLYRYLEEQAG